jgi:hypothetical protein
MTVTTTHQLSWLVVFPLASVALGQDTISTDRPGITLSPAVVGQGVFQIEAGVPQITTSHGHGTDADLLSLPVQLRFGLSPAVELRLGGTVWNRLADDASGEDAEGTGDVELGTKVALTGNDADVRTAAIFGLRLPVGDDDFSNHQAGYSASLAASMSLDSSDFLTAILGITRTPIDGENVVTGSLGLLYGHSFEDTPLGAYVEAGWFPDLESSFDMAVAGAGITYLVNADLQLDAFGDFGLNEDTPDATLGVGVSWRW